MEAIVLVCDYGDGRTALEQVTLSVRGRRLVVDLCAQHLGELTKNARAPRPGRRRKAAAAPVAKRRGRPPGSKNKATAKNGRRKATRKRVTAKKATRTTRARGDRRRSTKPTQAR